ncbi:outer membrane protein assembly factor BamD [Peiella sedimenti]|uniref:outer membrane protein assembly factor BamD n=1 Tax=Peiella sedimenti TaxID=3061083 RepID=UPI003CC7088F
MAAALLVSACAGERRRPRLQYQERAVELLYGTGVSRLESRRWDEATTFFEEVERQHPYSEWSRRAILMQVYAHYQGNNYEEAIAAADRFIRLYPGSSSAPYAFYMKAICYFEQIVDVGRDQGVTVQARTALQDVVRRYPNTAYAADARLKLDMVADQLAGKEMAVGRWYQSQNQLLAAAGRYKHVIDQYQTTSHTPEALYRLVEVYLTMGLREEAIRNGSVLGFNYPGSVWYADAYRLLAREGARPDVEPQAPARGWRRFIPGVREREQDRNFGQASREQQRQELVRGIMQGGSEQENDARDSAQEGADESR